MNSNASREDFSRGSSNCTQSRDSPVGEVLFSDGGQGHRANGLRSQDQWALELESHRALAPTRYYGQTQFSMVSAKARGGVGHSLHLQSVCLLAIF